MKKMKYGMTAVCLAVGMMLAVSVDRVAVFRGAGLRRHRRLPWVHR